LLRKHLAPSGQPEECDFTWRYLWGLADTSTNRDSTPAVRNSAPGLATRNIESPLVFLPSNVLASACADDIARQFDLTTLEPVVEMAGVKDPLQMCSDGHTLMAAGYSGLQVWDLRSQNLAPIWFFPRDGDWAVSAFSRDGKWAVARNSGGQLQFIDAMGRRELNNLVAHQGNIRALAFSPDDRRVASAGMDGRVVVWDFESQRKLQTLDDHTGTVVALAFSSDGKTLASAGADKVIHLWQPGTSAKPMSLAGHGSTVWALAFSPDGRTLASGGADGTVRLWEPGSGVELARLGTGESGTNEPSRSPARLAFSPAGNLLAARLFDGTLRVWRAAGLSSKLAADNR
jgi:WD40 repeat protein